MILQMPSPTPPENPAAVSRYNMTRDDGSSGLDNRALWLRSQSEFCIVVVRGKPQLNPTNQTTGLNAPLREHSHKPNQFYRMAEDLCISRRIDFFFHENRPGWRQVGNDVSKFDGAA